ncbi:unnamed protein product, partial [Gulo gulo]
GQPWCEIQGQVNGNKFLSYDCQSKEFKPIGPWGMKLKDTAFRQKQEETLKLLVEELRNCWTSKQRFSLRAGQVLSPCRAGSCVSVGPMDTPENPGGFASTSS